ncbi:nucleotidyltransferase [Cellulosilyticum sp. ST5]|uniref:SMODS domain-containing nucleotidyltransferase n=1 Tax=Cellulosilyticum sp. ST5 TaxID=3055805 RepID=UPI0039778F54
MAITVNEAFSEFMKDVVNLIPDSTNKARTSRDNLIDNINGFSGDDDFFAIYQERNLKFGSFARRTKIRELDDIDLMLCLSAEATRTYIESTECIYITGNDSDKANAMLTEGTNNINSTKVINRVISKLSELNDYSKAEMHKNQEAATLKMNSYTWNFDIIPCFYTKHDFYLIPDGSGNWKKTDPRIDNERTTTVNQKHNGKILELIRLMKYWNKRKVTLTIGSYLLECMILNIYEEKETKKNWWIDLEFMNLLSALSNAIKNDVKDPKGLQGNLNNFNTADRLKISNALYNAYNKACEAWNYENDKKQKEAIGKWSEVLGSSFPGYTGN